MRWILATAVTLAPSLAAAHISLVSPAPRTTSQKAGPCGAAGSVRGTNVTTLAPGATITVTWKETIDHPGHFRIAFDGDGQDFPVPASIEEGATAGMETVLVDPIKDIQGGGLPAGGRMYTQAVTLPDVECDNCTLQVIQLMTDKPPYTLPTDAGGSNDIYYQCADIKLQAGAPDPEPTDPDPTDPDPTDPDPTDPMGDLDGGGCSTGAGAGLFAAFGLLGLRRRRRH